jgi:hypothetical protein
MVGIAAAICAVTNDASPNIGDRATMRSLTPAISLTLLKLSLAAFATAVRFAPLPE